MNISWQESKYFVYPLAVLAMSLFVILGCSDDDPEPKFALTLEVNPVEAGDVTGAGTYEAGAGCQLQLLPAKGGSMSGGLALPAMLMTHPQPGLR